MIELTKDAKHWHKLWSMRIIALIPLLVALEAILPLWGVVLPAGLFNALTAIVGTAAAMARVIKQTKLSEGANE